MKEKNQSSTEIKQKNPYNKPTYYSHLKPTQLPSSHLKYKHKSYTPTTTCDMTLPSETNTSHRQYQNYHL